LILRLVVNNYSLKVPQQKKINKIVLKIIDFM